jgi:hypothetical protein
MADAVGAKGEDRQDIIGTALAVGQWLAEVKRPGRWDTLQVGPVLDLVPGDARERGRFLLTLSGLLGYAGLAGLVAEDEARRCLEEVYALADDAIVANFARTTARRFRRAGGSRRRAVAAG